MSKSKDDCWYSRPDASRCWPATGASKVAYEQKQGRLLIQQTWSVPMLTCNGSKQGCLWPKARTIAHTARAIADTADLIRPDVDLQQHQISLAEPPIKVANE
jgi:hypothetical protein